MKMFYKSKHGIVLMVILTLMMQIVGPVMGDYVYAEPKMEVDLDIDGESVDTNEKDETKPTDPEEVEGDEDPTEAVGGELEGETEAKDESEKQEEAGLIELENPVILPLANGVPKDLGNIFTLESFKVNGTEADESQVVVIGDGTTVYLDYTWAVGSDAKAGDYAEIDVPDAFKLDRNFENQDIKLNDGTVVGTYSLINNKIRFVFDEKIKDVAPVDNGVLGFGVKFNEEKFKEDVVTEIEFNDKGEKTIIIIGKPSVEISSINKLGTPDSTTNAKMITWTVDITNPSNTEIINAKLKDILPEGLELDSSSVKVNNLNIKLNGDLSEGNEVTVGSPTIDGQNFELDLPTITPYKGYRIEYTTIITDQSKRKFTNAASLEYGEEELPADVTVSIERSADIEKDGKYLGNDEIEWWIDVNKSGGSIENAIVEDVLPAGVELIEGSIKVFKLTQSGDNWTESDSGKIAEEFPVTLGQIDEAYRIKFKTSIDYAEVNGGEYKNDNSFTNETTLKNGENEIGEAEKTVKISRDPILSKDGKQYVDYEKKEIKWTVTVNKANHPIKGAIVTDILPKGLTISESDIVIKNSEGTVVTDKIITVPGNDGSEATEVTIKLGDINEEYTIEYTTKITDFNEDEFFNGVSLGGTGVGPGPGGTIKPVRVKPAKNSYTKSYKGIDYNEKTMSWETVANPTREAFKTFKITDTFPNNGLILLSNTLEVKVGGAVKTLNTHYRLTPIDGDHNNGFVVEFIGDVLPINAKIVMTYTTSYDPEKGIKPNTGEYKVNGEKLVKDGSKANYINKVKFEGKTVNDNEIDVTRNVQKQVNPETVNTGKKVGKLISLDEEDNIVRDSKGNIIYDWISGYTRKIQWEIYTNYLKQDLGSGINITDELGYEGVIDKDSIQVRKYTVASGGGTTLGDDINTAKLQLMALLSAEKYSVVMDENNKGFTLTFNEDVNERYAVTFTTSVPDISLGNDGEGKGKYTNTATLNTKDGKYEYKGSIGFDNADSNLSKESLNTGDKVYTDDEINWNIKINQGLSIVHKDVTVIDTISPGMVYKEGSLKVYRLQGTERVPVDPVSEKGYTLEVENNDEDEETSLTILFKDSISSAYEIEYTTVVTATGDDTGGEPINNSVNYSGTNLINVPGEGVDLTAEQFSYIGGDPSKGKIIINKVDNEGKKITAEAEFQVYYMLNGEERLVSGESFKTDKDGKIEVGNLVVGNTYFIREVKAPNGFKFDPKDFPKEVKVTKAAGKDDSGAYKYSIKNENTKTQVKVVKVWNDGPQVKPTIKLQLYRNNKVFREPVILVDGETEYTWEDLNLTNNAGKEYKYTVDEIDLPAGYKKTVSVSGPTTTIFNTYQVKRTDITGRKVWVGGPDVKPNIRLQLYQNGAPYGDPVTLLSGNTSYTWKDLPLSDNFGNPFTYTMDELNEPENYPRSTENSVAMYGVSRSHDGLTVTNTYKSPVTDVTGRKVWINGPEVKPTIGLQLYRNGEALGEPVELENGAFEYVWKDLDITDNDGVDYIYTVKEINTPENYTKVEEVLTVTNTYESPKTEITGTKVWIDGPEDKPTIELQLYRNGVTLEGKVATLESGTEEHTWTDLDLTDENGVNYKYTVEEIDVPENYEKLEEGLKVTNRYVSPKTTITGTKVWIGGPELKPTIELQLHRNGEPYGDPVVLEDGTTTYTWDDLDLTDEFGENYKYTVDEVTKPENYPRSVRNSASMYGVSRSEDGLTVTNTYKSPVSDITGRKVWVNGPEVKPTIELQLYRDGEVYLEPVELESGTYEYVWEDLDITDSAGIDYEYTVREVGTPDNYTKVEEGLTVTNTYVSSKIEVTGKKEWVDGPELKPTIQLQLYRNGEALEGKIVSLLDGETTHTWEDLDLTDENGVDYIYTVDEVERPENYGKSVSEDGLTLTNTYQSPVTDITGRKVWKGGSRTKPTIELQLYRDGEALGEPVELRDGTYEYTWVDLDLTDLNGKEYKYTIDEVRTPYRYGKTISEDGLTITNRYYPPTDPEYPDPTDPTDPDPKDPPKEDPKDPDKPVDPEDPKEEDPETPDPTDPDQPETEDPVDPDPTDPEEDPEEEPPTTIVLDPPTKGSVTVDENGNWLYTPNPGATGKDSFTIVHPDGREELIEIDLDDLPLGTTKVTKDTLKKLPKTGAVGNLGFYFTGLSLIFLGIFLRRRIA